MDMDMDMGAESAATAGACVPRASPRDDESRRGASRESPPALSAASLSASVDVADE